MAGFLSGLGDLLGIGGGSAQPQQVQQPVNQSAPVDPGILESIFMASRPGQRYYQVLDDRNRTQALRDLGQNAEGLGPLDIAQKYAAATGDVSPLLNYQMSQEITPYQRAQLDIDRQRIAAALRGSGNTAYFADAEGLMKADPSLSFQEAYSLARNGLKQGLTIGPDGQVVPIQGALTALGDLKYGENLGGERGKNFAAGEAALPKLASSYEATKDSNAFIGTKIDDIEKRIGSLTAGFGGSILDAVPGSPAYDLKADLSTIQANSGFDRLQEMRNNSPTGGALGSITETELAKLEAAQGNLVNSQSPEQLKKNLDLYKKQREISFKRIEDAYKRDLEKYGGNSVNLPQPSAQDKSGWSIKKVGQ